MFLTPITLEEMGFDSVESFLLSLNDSVLHMRYVNKKILVYPHADNEESEKDNPLPHITEVSLLQRMNSFLTCYCSNIQVVPQYMALLVREHVADKDILVHGT
jgi:hypothetical protein